MPIYEYRCVQCGHIFEKFQSIGADNSELECPECGTPRPTRVFSAFASHGLAGKGEASGASGSSCGKGGFT
ncbi:zinc ribbon domain-containing protein [candidate division KSB1 bacterium]|nr:zinc ribbon domain-containing protein [candidate division KSB1 bacterium]